MKRPSERARLCWAYPWRLRKLREQPWISFEQEIAVDEIRKLLAPGFEPMPAQQRCIEKYGPLEVTVCDEPVRRRVCRFVSHAPGGRHEGKIYRRRLRIR